MSKILITCYLPFEFNEARNQLGLKELTKKGDIPRVAEGGNITLLYCGVGKLNTTSSIVSYLKNKEIDIAIDSGTAGSLNKKIDIMDIVYSTDVTDFYADGNPGENILSSFSFNDNITKVRIGSIEKSVTETSDRDKLLKFSIDVVTWETSALFKICKLFDIIPVSVRGITDNCNINTDLDFKNNRIELCKILYKNIKKLCKSI